MDPLGRSMKQELDRGSSSLLSFATARFKQGIRTYSAGGWCPEDAVRILVVEDEKKVATALQQGLEAEAYEVTLAADGDEGFDLLGRERFDLVLLDLALPRLDGFDLLCSLRKRNSMTPVFILTARDAFADRVL